jgi:hypothetical protein
MEGPYSGKSILLPLIIGIVERRQQRSLEDGRTVALKRKGLLLPTPVPPASAQSSTATWNSVHTQVRV